MYLIHLTAFTLSAISFVYTQILIHPDHIFGNIWKKVKMHFTKIEQVPIYKHGGNAVHIPPGDWTPAQVQEMMDEQIKGWAQKEIPHWILKPLGDCIYCFSGQFALWVYLIGSIFYWPYNFWEHVLWILLAIFYSAVIKNFIKI